jgi:hypothetical protein
MALTLDAQTNYNWTGATTKSGTDCTWSHTCTGSDLILVVLSAIYSGTGEVTGVTYNGDALTNIFDYGSVHNVTAWYKLGPATGAHNIVATLNAATSAWSGRQGFAAFSFTGAHQTSPLGTHAELQDYVTTISRTLTTAAGEILVDCCRCAVNVTEGANQTRYASDELGFSLQAGADGGVMSWSRPSDGWITMGAVPIKPAPASSTAIPVLMNQYRQRR